MNRTLMTGTGLLLAGILLLSSCRPSRVWENKKKNDRVRTVAPAPPPPAYRSAPLVIHPTPGFTMNRHANGRYFHRSPRGYVYWKSFDNRFYIDASHLSGIRYSEGEYREWKRVRNESRHNRG